MPNISSLSQPSPGQIPSGSPCIWSLGCRLILQKSRATADDNNVPESVVSDAGVGGEADDGEALRGGDLRREDGCRAAAELAQALGGAQRRRILTVLKKISI